MKGQTISARTPAEASTARRRAFSDDIVIRAATLADLGRVLHHRRAMFEQMGYNDRTALDAMQRSAEPFFAAGLADGSYRGWLAEARDGHVVAGGGVGILPWPPHPHDPKPCRATIFNVYTEPEYRRRGIARRLMGVMIEWCRQAGFAVVNLHASDDGRPLYLAMGFEPTTELRLALKQ